MPTASRSTAAWRRSVQRGCARAGPGQAGTYAPVPSRPAGRDSVMAAIVRAAGDLPAERAGAALDRAHDPGRHPAAVEPARLGRGQLIPDPRLVNLPGIERHVVADGLVAGH